MYGWAVDRSAGTIRISVCGKVDREEERVEGVRGGILDYVAPSIETGVSDEALACTVGPLIEVPVLLGLVFIVRDWEAGGVGQ